MMMMTWRRALLGAGRRARAGGSVRRGVMVVMSAGAAVLCAGLLTGAAAAPAAAGARGAVREAQWGRAQEVRGMARLNTRRSGAANWVSCWSVNNCAASGYYTNSHGQHLFVVAERNGRWGKARQVPGLGALNTGGNAAVTSLSCASGGYCVAAGYYTGAAGHTQGFVVTGVKGRWRNAAAVPGLAALNTSGNAQVTSVSCPAAGECVAGGYYDGRSCYYGGLCQGQGFVVSQASGVWGTAADVPGLAALNVGGSASVASLSCGSAGNCAAGGSYTASPPNTASPVVQVFVVSEVNGVWGAAEEVPVTAAPNTYGTAQVSSVSCARDGYCAVGGYYTPTNSADYADLPFVASGQNGRWDTAVTLGGPGLGEYDGYIDLVSCPSAGSCVAIGYTDSECCQTNSDEGYNQVSVATQVKGVWGQLDLLPGKLAQGSPSSVSCPSAGNCAVGGGYGPESSIGNPQGFVASETNGRWAKAEPVPGIKALGLIGSGVNSVSCPSAGHCTAAGTYHNGGQAFVTAPR
jgi:hypothetical protein